MKLLKQLHEQHKKDFEFKNSEKIDSLNKENQLLLNRLLEISAPVAKTIGRK